MEESIIQGSGNVYQDLGFPSPEQWEAKAQLAGRIIGLIQDRGWTQTEAAHQLGTNQVEISNINRGQLQRFTLDRLMSYLRQLNSDVEIRIHSRRDKKRGHLAVNVA